MCHCKLVLHVKEMNLILVGLLWLRITGVSGNSRPNIIIVIADDMGHNDVGFHSGHINTPNIDALAYNSVILKRHYTQPMCTPSRTALLTGDYPIRHGMQGSPSRAGNADGLPLNLKLMPEYFSELGYQTHLVGKWHLGYQTKWHLPTRRGFDTFFGFLNGYIGYWDGVHQDMGIAGRDMWRGEKRAWKEVYGRYMTEVLTEEAVNIIRNHSKPSGLFVMLSHTAVHTTELSMRREAPPNSNSTSDHGIYKEMVERLDWSIGEIIQELNKKKILQNTIIIFLSDNGAPTENMRFSNTGSNWPFRGKKNSVHEGGVRTVGMIYSQHIQIPRLYNNLFHITDWFPTLYDAAGGDVRDLKAKDGVSHWNSLVDGEGVPRSELLVDIDDILSTEAYVWGNWKLVRNRRPGKGDTVNDHFPDDPKGYSLTYSIEAVMNSSVGKILGVPEDWSAIKTQSKELGNCQDRTELERRDCHNKYCLFDLDFDPSECEDLAESEIGVVGKLKMRLDDYRKVLIPKKHKLFEINAEPSRFGDYWSPWRDSKETDTCSEGISSNTMFTYLAQSLLVNIFIQFRSKKEHQFTTLSPTFPNPFSLQIGSSLHIRKAYGGSTGIFVLTTMVIIWGYVVGKSS